MLSFHGSDFYKDLYSGRYDDKEKVVLTLEEPNFCVAPGDKVRLHEVADKILTICPYTAEVFENREFVFFPFSEDWIPPASEKIIDVSYFGSMPKMFLGKVILKMYSPNIILDLGTTVWEMFPGALTPIR